MNEQEENEQTEDFGNSDLGNGIAVAAIILSIGLSIGLGSYLFYKGQALRAEKIGSTLLENKK